MDEMERAANMGATFLPMIDEDQRPAIMLPVPRSTSTVLVFAYWRDGELVLSVDLDEAGDDVEMVDGVARLK